MSEQTDKPLHDWVRQSMDAYRPDYNPTDWVALQRTLRRRLWMRWSMWGSGSLVLLGFLSWFILRQPMDKIAYANKVTSTNKTPQREENQATAIPSVVSSLPSDLAQHKLVPTLSKRNPAKAMQSAESGTVHLPNLLLSLSDIKSQPTNLTDKIHYSQPVAFSPEETTIKQQILTGDFGSDSTSYQALARNLRAWPEAVIVCDLTTSMYPYTTQLFAWFKKNARNPDIKGLVFFTDCDSLGQQTRPGGPAGRMFITHELNPTQGLPVLVEAARNTIQNKDDAENDIEALLKAQQAFPDAKHLILIADNMSAVKDMALLANVRKPVHVVLCGTTGSDTTLAFQPNYYTIASQTRGSLHTLEDDLIPSRLSKSTTLRVGSVYYRYRPRTKQFKPTPFNHRPRNFLGFLWL
ncbi:hypothetical protein [Spirosoma foliorum]|uniref:Uncharacterized protein n=1 Tax=Spirosoma foliorum TaxID=2710596 RepID=A0A7G5GVQ8_9BACT|nr:hypothetical protein [Spirosoma foliorum]QMW02950.1 hypothetical protein H3H32_34545 [Spirosoma foliorum]